ncbi:uncharacterized protein LOC120261989 [Dioscorea cayenensis subsp. rotundata]|uniref:Uncharacterized protein LOC120261989 n=1 Tax=Dioscorea cayennensis subsp. rotundata TaxID=55577 RepID=A0AB40BH55_DIOCR|nr:uncharacterized protein LOC120261989 [Dioscorea cayenensis subsp. rotundata]
MEHSFHNVGRQVRLVGFHDGTIEPSIDEPHRWQDFAVRSWIYGSVSEEIEIIVEPNQTKRETWTTIEELFRYNKESRTVFLKAEFRSIVQGDMTIADYCRKIKKISDALCDVGQPVFDKTLVLNTLRGLNKRFSSTAQLIPLLYPFPSFLCTRSILAMMEIKAAHETVVVAGTALLSFTAGALSNSQSGISGRSDKRGKSSGGRKKWNKSSNKSRDNSHVNAGGNGDVNARPGAPRGGPAFLGLGPLRPRPTQQEVYLCCLHRLPLNLHRQLRTLSALSQQ